MNINKLIVAVDRIQASEVKGYHRIGLGSVKVSTSIGWKNIKVKVPARLNITDKVEDGVRLYTAKLVFRTCEEMFDCEKQVYRCKTASGNYILIGSDTRPYPITTVNDSHPDNMTDSQLIEVSVDYTSPVRIPYIY